MIIRVDAFAAVAAVGIVCSCFVSEYIFPLAVVGKLDYHCSGKELVLPPRRPERYVDLVPGNREPFFWC